MRNRTPMFLWLCIDLETHQLRMGVWNRSTHQHDSPDCYSLSSHAGESMCIVVALNHGATVRVLDMRLSYWSPAVHLNFYGSFRAAVEALLLLLCCREIAWSLMPREVVWDIISFLPVQKASWPTNARAPISGAPQRWGQSFGFL